MNNIEFAKNMLRMGELLAEVKQLELELAAHVVDLEKTQAIGNVTAKYSPGRTTYDWERTVREHPTAESEPEAHAELVAQYTETTHPEPVTKTDWAGIAHRMNWDGIVAKEPVPSVKFILEE